MLPTPPRDDAVTFNYGVVANSDRDLHPADSTPSRAHTKRQLGELPERTTNTALSPTNNAAEQVLRSIVLKRKISGPTRSLRGDHFVARGFSIHETCLRQGVELWKFMHAAMLASIANTVPPSLIPRSLAAVPTG